MRKTNPPSNTAPKTVQEVPDWAKKIKSYREEAGITQGDIQKAFKAKYNVMSPVETGRRKFTPDELKAFFELISKPEDTSIPTSDRNLVPAAPKKAARPVKKVIKVKVKGVKPTEKLAKVAKVGRAAKNKVSLVANPAPEGKALVTSIEAGNEVGASSAVVDIPKPMPDAKAAAAPKTAAATKAGRKPRSPKPIDVAPRTSAPAQTIPVKAGSDSKTAISPVKEAVLRDISRVLSSPGLSDNQAKRLHGLFTSLAVNALLGE